MVSSFPIELKIARTQAKLSFPFSVRKTKMGKQGLTVFAILALLFANANCIGNKGQRKSISQVIIANLEKL